MTDTKSKGGIVETGAIPIMSSGDKSEMIGAKNWDAIKFEQSEVAYNVYTNTPSQVCANCRWFVSENAYRPCHIVENEPLPIVASGYCNQWLTNPKAMEMPEMETEVEIEIEGDVFIDSVHPAVGLVSKMWETKSIQPLLDYVSGVFSDKHLPGSFMQSGFKLLDNNKWLAWFTNNFEDKESELFTDKAIATYQAKVEGGLIPYPELWYYHVKGTRVGQATKLFHVGHFLVALGEWDNPQENKLVAPIRKWAKSADIRLSHGFFYEPSQKIKGVYHDFATFEITLLDNGIEANPYTPFNNPIEVGEVTKIMSVTQTQKDALYEVFDKTLADEIIKGASEGGKALETMGVAYKKAMTDKPKKGDGMDGEEDEEMKPKDKMFLSALAILNTKIDKIAEQVTGTKADSKKADDNLALIQSQDSALIDIQTQLGALTKAVNSFMQAAPRASKSSATLISDDSYQANLLHKKNFQGGKQPVGLLEQAMKGNFNIDDALFDDDDGTFPAPPNGITE